MTSSVESVKRHLKPLKFQTSVKVSVDFLWQSLHPLTIIFKSLWALIKNKLYLKTSLRLSQSHYKRYKVCWRQRWRELKKLSTTAIELLWRSLSRNKQIAKIKTTKAELHLYDAHLIINSEQLWKVDRKQNKYWMYIKLSSNQWQPISWKCRSNSKRKRISTLLGKVVRQSLNNNIIYRRIKERNNFALVGLHSRLEQ